MALCGDSDSAQMPGDFMNEDVWQLVWDDSLSLGIAEIDEDHRRFISLIDDLNHAIMSRQEKPKIERALNLVIADAQSHFEHEETLLSRHGYPEVNHHAELHAELTLQLLGVMDAFNSSELSYEWIENALRIKKLVVDHLLDEDMKYRDFLKLRLKRA
jgi:hemerythrin